MDAEEDSSGEEEEEEGPAGASPPEEPNDPDADACVLAEGMALAQGLMLVT